MATPDPEVLDAGHGRRVGREVGAGDVDLAAAALARAGDQADDPDHHHQGGRRGERDQGATAAWVVPHRDRPGRAASAGVRPGAALGADGGQQVVGPARRGLDPHRSVGEQFPEATGRTGVGRGPRVRVAALAVEEVGELVLVHSGGTCRSSLVASAQYDDGHDPVLGVMMVLTRWP